ncbi:MAG: hypothetical protein U0X20_07965 [Caldilineaceae bacterium]
MPVDRYQEKNDQSSTDALMTLLEILRGNKPTDRSEIARVYAVTITEVEKALGFFVFFIAEAHRNNPPGA